MSLQIWLPMTKDLRQQGLSNAMATNNGATFSSGGKLGGCYSFGTGSSYITVDSDCLKTFTEFSFACWVKIISWNTSYSTIFAAKNGTSVSWTNLIFSLLRNSSNSTLCFSISNGSSYTSTNCQTGALSLNTWYHITCTYKNGEIKLYQDGNVVSTYTTTVVPNFNSIVNLWIGKSNANSYQSNNLLNDVRVYDHCLSSMEVKELAKGLVLHYPLNRQGWGQENLFNWSNNETGITLNNYQNKGSFTQFSNSLTFDPSTTTGEKYTISFWAKSPNGSTRLMIYNQNGNPQYFYFGSSPYLTNSLGNTWEYFTRTITNTQYSGTGTPSTNTNVWRRIEIYAPDQMGVQVKHIKVEKGEKATPWCPNSSDASATTMSLNSTTEYDCSGFCNNGTRTGTLDWTSDTPKYSVSTTFGGSQYILADSPSSEGATLALWAKTASTGRRALIIDYKSGLGMGFWDGYIIPSCNSAIRITYPNSAYHVNEWNHIVMVKNSSSSILCYINGELQDAGSTQDYWSSNIVDGFSIAARPNGASPSACQISDVYIYATALSAADVKSLYEANNYEV